MTAPNLWQVPAPSLAGLRWIRRQGVSRSALLSPWPIGATNVTLKGNTFEQDSNGEHALTFLIEDGGEVIDVAAWQPRAGRLTTLLNAGFAIGQEAIFNPATYFAGGALYVHETPLHWLLAEREGICIVRPDLTHAYLANCQRLAFVDAAHARTVQRWLERKPTAQILVEIPAERAAA